MRCVDPRRHQFHFLLTSGSTGTLDDEVRRLGGRIHYLRIGPAFGPKFRRLIRHEEIDVVHSHMTLISAWVMQLAAMAGVPKRIVHFRTSRPSHQQSFVRSLLQAFMRHWVNQYATHILAVGEASMSSMWPRWRTDPRCTVIYNGLDLSAFRDPADPQKAREEFGLSRECTLYIHVGSFTRAKNHARLASIFAAICRNDPTARFMLVGGDRSARLKRRVCAQIAALGLSESVLPMGERGDVARLLRAADLMVFPSTREGLPGAVLEACAAGTPVLASDLPGVREIQRFLPGICCQSLADSDLQWATKARELASASRLSPVLRQAALDRVLASPFTVQHCLERLYQIWDGEPERVAENALSRRPAA